MNPDDLVARLLADIAEVEGPRTPSRSDACKWIRATYPTLTATLEGKEIMIAYRGTRGKQRLASAYFTEDATDAIATAASMSSLGKEPPPGT